MGFPLIPLNNPVNLSRYKGILEFGQEQFRFVAVNELSYNCEPSQRTTRKIPHSLYQFSTTRNQYFVNVTNNSC